MLARRTRTRYEFLVFPTKFWPLLEIPGLEYLPAATAGAAAKISVHGIAAVKLVARITLFPFLLGNRELVHDTCTATFLAARF